MTKNELKDKFLTELDKWEINERKAALSLKVWEFFEPHLKVRAPKQKIEIDQEQLKAFNESFPEGKSGSGKRMRCNLKELEKAFQYFFKLYPETTWPIILQATQLYLSEQEKDNFKWCRTAKYFCIKFKQPGQPESELIEYVERIQSGAQIDDEKGFDITVL